MGLMIVVLTLLGCVACSPDETSNLDIMASEQIESTVGQMATASDSSGAVQSETLMDGQPVDVDGDVESQLDSGVLAVMTQNRPCDDSGISLPEGWASALMGAGFTKCVTPFGVIVAADGSMPDTYIDMVARIVAELIDPDMDGEANDPEVLAYLAGGRQVWLPMPVDQDPWRRGLEASLEGRLGAYGIMIPSWWLGGLRPDGPDTQAKAVMVEEVIHAFTQFGYGLAYPDVFGVENWRSLIGQETQAAQCDWWQHPENSCPGQPSEGGDCSDPSCDITEFYQQVVVLRAGMTPGWFGIGFPTTQADLDIKLSAALKAVIDDPQYNQLRAPLSFEYGQR